MATVLDHRAINSENNQSRDRQQMLTWRNQKKIFQSNITQIPETAENNTLFQTNLCS